MGRDRRDMLLSMSVGKPGINTISGTITDGVTPVQGVLVTFGNRSALTAADGTYTITGICADVTDNLTPTKTGYLFDPQYLTMTTNTVIVDEVDKNFIPFAMILNDTFTTAASAPLTTPRTAEPGPGTLAITDAGNIASIASGNLVFNGTASGTSGFIQNDAVARAAGRAFQINYANITANGLSRFGLAASLTGPSYRTDLQPTQQYLYEAATAMYYPSMTPPGNVTIVERATGAFTLVGSQLWNVSNSLDTALKTCYWVAAGQTPNISISSVLTADLVSMNADSKVYTNYVASPSDGETTTMAANAIVEFTWTPAESETLTIQFRRTDDDNTMKVVCVQAASTIKLYTRDGGSDTEITGGKVSEAQTWTPATAYRIIIRAYDNKIWLHVGTGEKHRASTSAYNQTVTGVKIGGFTTGASLYCWKADLTSLLPDFMKPVIPARYYLTIGDSKTVNKVWQHPFESIVNSATSRWTLVDNISTAGWSAHVVQGIIDASLAALPASPAPEFCCVNLGTNDVNGDVPNDVFYGDANEDGAEWTAKMQYIIDAVHAKWGSCAVYAMRPWKPNVAPYDFQTKLTLIDDTLIAAVVSGRAWAHVGPDESVFLEAGDDGATYISADRIHPNIAGYALTAAQWKTAVGL